MSPRFIVWRELQKAELIQVLPQYALPSLAAYAVYPQTRYLSQRARALIDFFVERFGDHPYWETPIAVSATDSHE